MKITTFKSQMSTANERINKVFFQEGFQKIFYKKQKRGAAGKHGPFLYFNPLPQ
jgi:hypothetical protein